MQATVNYMLKNDIKGNILNITSVAGEEPVYGAYGGSKILATGLTRGWGKMFAADGITISGGDPLEQLEELRILLRELRRFTTDILVYTGYVWADFADSLSQEVREELLTHISVLVDGPYREEENYPELTMRGSANQKIYYFGENIRKKYEDYIKQGRTLENFFIDNTFLTIGIMDR